MDIVELLDRALDQTGEIVSGVTADQWDLPTPCEEWNVRTVVGHLVRGNQNTAAVAEGRPRQPNPIADVRDEPIAAYRKSAEAVKRAWRDRSTLDQEYQSPFGMVPGRFLLNLRLADNVTHGWDLARATGQTPSYDDDIVQVALDFVESTFRNRPPSGPFAPAVTVSEECAPIDRLAALTDRQP